MILYTHRNIVEIGIPGGTPVKFPTSQLTTFWLQEHMDGQPNTAHFKTVNTIKKRSRYIFWKISKILLVSI